MNSRERILSAINHSQPDRVPVDIGATPSSGISAVAPVQINAANMEPERLKNEFGKDLTFWGGGCNTQTILNHATPAQVKDHVRHNIEIFNKGGGYVFNTVHNILPDVPPENILAMIEAVHEF